MNEVHPVIPFPLSFMSFLRKLVGVSTRPKAPPYAAPRPADVQATQETQDNPTPRDEEVNLFAGMQLRAEEPEEPSSPLSAPEMGEDAKGLKDSTPPSSAFSFLTASAPSPPPNSVPPFTTTVSPPEAHGDGPIPSVGKPKVSPGVITTGSGGSLLPQGGPRDGPRRKKRHTTGFRPGFAREEDGGDGTLVPATSTTPSSSHKTSPTESPLSSPRASFDSVTSNSSPVPPPTTALETQETPTVLNLPSLAFSMDHLVIDPHQVEEDQERKDREKKIREEREEREAQEAREAREERMRQERAATIEAEAKRREREAARKEEEERRAREKEEADRKIREEEEVREAEVNGPRRGLQALAEILEGIQQHDTEAKVHLGELNGRHRSIIQRKHSLVSHLVTLRETVRRKESEQAVVSEREDYEKAAELGESIEETLTEIRQTQSILTDISTQYDTIEEEKVACAQRAIEYRRETVDLLEKLNVTVRAGKKGYASKEYARTSDGMEKLDTKQNTISMRRSAAVKDLNKVESEKAALQQEIDSQTGDFRIERSLASAKRDAIRTEISELKRQLAEKEREDAEQTALRDAAQSKISAVEARYEKQRRQIQEVYDRELERKTALDDELDFVEREKEHIVNEIERVQRLEKQYDEVLQRVGEAVSDTLSMIEKLNDEQSVKREASARQAEALAEEGEDRARVERLRVDAETCDRTVQELQAAMFQLQSDASRLRQSVAGIDSRIPDMEAEKRLAVGARNFKEAARISNEIKTSTASREASVSLLEQVLQDFAQKEEELGRTKEECHRLQEELTMKERAYDMRRLKRLVHEEEQYRSELDSAVSAERYDEADLAQTHLDACTSEIAQVQQKHKLTDLAVQELRLKDANHKQTEEEEEEKEEEKEEEEEEEEEEEAEEEEHQQEEEEEAEDKEEVSVFDGDDGDVEALRTQLDSLEQELQVAVEKEDYEAADEIQKTISRVESVLKRLPTEEKTCERASTESFGEVEWRTDECTIET